MRGEQPEDGREADARTCGPTREVRGRRCVLGGASAAYRERRGRLAVLGLFEADTFSETRAVETALLLQAGWFMGGCKGLAQGAQAAGAGTGARAPASGRVLPSLGSPASPLEASLSLE